MAVADNEKSRATEEENIHRPADLPGAIKSEETGEYHG